MAMPEANSSGGYEATRNPSHAPDYRWQEGYRFALRNLNQPGVLRDAARYREEAERERLSEDGVQDSEPRNPNGAAGDQERSATAPGLPLPDVQSLPPDEAGVTP